MKTKEFVQQLLAECSSLEAPPRRADGKDKRSAVNPIFHPLAQTCLQTRGMKTKEFVQQLLAECSSLEVPPRRADGKDERSAVNPIFHTKCTTSKKVPNFSTPFLDCYSPC
jgi:hypothetical protein